MLRTRGRDSVKPAGLSRLDLPTVVGRHQVSADMQGGGDGQRIEALEACGLASRIAVRRNSVSRSADDTTE